MDWKAIIYKYYPDDNDLRRLLLKHSRDVADRALLVAERHPELVIDREFLEEGAMLHDLGIFMTDAPGIYCYGKDPYILHGIRGGEILRQEGFPDHARICERHTGTGLTAEHIMLANLPLPIADFVPETIEEQVVCYADKFYSKSHPDRVRSAEQTIRSLFKYGNDGVEKFRRWHERFG